MLINYQERSGVGFRLLSFVHTNQGMDWGSRGRRVLGIVVLFILVFGK
jgi:hypothetical protein